MFKSGQGVYPKKGEMHLWIGLPKKEELEETKINVGHDYKYRTKYVSDRSPSMLEWYRMPDGVYTHKEYPICPKCKDKFVPIGDYKRCFKCRFTN